MLIAQLELPDEEAHIVLQAEDALARLMDLGLLETAAEGMARLDRLLTAFVRTTDEEVIDRVSREGFWSYVNRAFLAF